MIKLGLPILYEYDNLEDNFKLAKKLGLDFVEMNLNFGYCRKEMEEGKVKELLEKYNLEATLHFYDEADMGSYDEVVDAYLVLLNKYASLGHGYIKMMNFHNIPGPVVTISGVKNYIYAKEYDEYLKRIIKNFKKAEAIVNKFDIKMVIENVDGAKNADFLMENFIHLKDEGFKFTYDIGHDNMQNDSVLKLLEKTELKFDEFHFHDGNRKACHLALGEGTINLKYFKDLAIKNDAYVLLEVKSSEDLIKSVPFFKAL
ncbi:MAG: TIM barrel protein [Bacilli bacterium]|nr:TIM barrel protein [Bacilli bacterium]